MLQDSCFRFFICAMHSVSCLCYQRRQEDYHKSEASLGYKRRPSSKIQNQAIPNKTKQFHVFTYSNVWSPGPYISQANILALPFSSVVPLCIPMGTGPAQSKWLQAGYRRAQGCEGVPGVLHPEGPRGSAHELTQAGQTEVCVFPALLLCSQMQRTGRWPPCSTPLREALFQPLP